MYGSDYLFPVLLARKSGGDQPTFNYGASLSMTIDSSTFVVTAQLLDQNGDALGQAQTIDLPLESVVVGGSYDDTTKKVVLTLQNGNTVEFSVADLVSGLQTELSASNKLNPAYINYDSTHAAVTEAEKTSYAGKQDAIDATHKLSADLVDDSTTTNKFVTAADKTKLGRVIMDSTETQDYYLQNSTPSNPSDGDYWFDGSDLVASDITAMTGYAKAQTASAISASDTLNQAIGKLEKKVDDNTTSLSSKQNQVLGSWTAGTATTHSTPASTDTVLQALEKIDNNQRLDETNISNIQTKTNRIIMDSTENTNVYVQATQPTGTTPEGSIWFDTGVVNP